MRMRRGETPQSFRRLQGEMNRLFENFFGGNGMQPQSQQHWSGLALPSETTPNSVASRQPTNVASGRTANNMPSQTANVPSQTPRNVHTQTNIPSQAVPSVRSQSQQQTPTTMPAGSTPQPNQAATQGQAGNWQFQFNPCIEVTEDAETIHVMAELPGIEQDNLELFCNDNSLTITGEKRNQRVEQGDGNFVQTERSYGYFRRSIPFNVDIDADSAEASYENGVLHVQLPKQGASQGTRLNIQ
jgi:HSP20 family molecular chaperone IbpA